MTVITNIKKQYETISTFRTDIFSLIANGQISSENESLKTEDGWKLLNENIYSVQYPENWELNNSGQMGMNFILL